jgi:FSR family fosmidomycin resistance protein-like MFS transporter
MTVLSACHLFTDVGQGSIPALLPFLIVRDHLSYASASALILAATVASSVIQPLFGLLSDRHSMPWLMPLGPVLGGLGVALAAIAPTYPLTFAAVVVSGIGVAAFHPEGSRFANYVSGARRSSGMSLFSVGGNIGFALGPALVTPLVLAFGLHGALLVIVPTSLMGLVTARELPSAPISAAAGRPTEPSATRGGRSPCSPWSSPCAPSCTSGSSRSSRCTSSTTCTPAAARRARR